MKHIYDIAAFCHANGMEHVILCPGSRSAPLAIAFMRYPHIKTYVIPDERSAGFIGLGIAQTTNKPVALVCTSGTATLNFYPAITEAFYRDIPLLALTADRPEEWIDQLDGQTIRQQNVYSNHIRASYQFPLLREGKDLKEAENMLKIAFKELRNGPVHINIPFEEPFYPDVDENITFSEFDSITVDNQKLLTPNEVIQLKEELKQFKHPIIVIGQQYLEYPIKEILEKYNVPIITDVISNYRGIKNGIEHQDFFLSKIAPEIDLVITFGFSVISKNLKLYLRAKRPLAHWHIGTKPAADTFRCLTKVIESTPFDFFSQISLMSQSTNTWLTIDENTDKAIKELLDKEAYGEFTCIFRILNKIPNKSHLHLANSMPVRYANYISTKAKDLTVHANRGTSGIDGTLSTAVGSAIAIPEELHVLLIGDLSLFYDRNGLWHPYIPQNLRIVLINNHGGGIFRMIPGPAKQPELEEYFVTHQPLKAYNLAKEANLDYLHCNDFESLENALSTLFDASESSKLLEIATDGKNDALIFQEFKNLPIS